LHPAKLDGGNGQVLGLGSIGDNLIPLRLGIGSELLNDLGNEPRLTALLIRPIHPSFSQATYVDKPRRNLLCKRMFR